MPDWEELDVKELLRKKRKQYEQTTSSNAGGFAVPLRPILRPIPQEIPRKKDRK